METSRGSQGEMHCRALAPAFRTILHEHEITLAVPILMNSVSGSRDNHEHPTQQGDGSPGTITSRW